MYHRVANRFLESAWGMVMPRGSYLPKEVRDTEPVNPEGTDLAIWKYEYGDKFVAIAFAGKSNKPLWHNSFRTEAARERHIDETIADRKSRFQWKQERQQARREWHHNLKEGDILYSSWGYDQTNVDFYQVTKVIDKMVVIREVASNVVSGDGSSESVVAVPNRFVGDAMKKIPTGTGNDVGKIRLTSFSWAYPWDGKPKHQTGPYGGH